MATIGIYDADFFNYQFVIPNLECAKLVTYYQKKREIAVLSPYLSPEKYTNFFIRKEYNDGIYPKQYFEGNCNYGGYAFGKNDYVPFKEEIENIIPDMHLYSQHEKYYSDIPTHQQMFKRILNCEHIRLMPRQNEKINVPKIIDYAKDHRNSGIFLHDYNIAQIPDITDILKEISNSRHFVIRPDDINPYPIGNKYPIKIYDEQNYIKWLNLTFMPRCLFFEYHGYLSDWLWVETLNKNKRLMIQMYYYIDDGCSDENDFLINRLPKIYKQALFFLKTNIKISLKYDDHFIKSQELKNFIELLNCWFSCKWQENFMPQYQTLYNFCLRSNHRKVHSWDFNYVTVTAEEARQSFQFLRERNYELFQMLYNWDSVIFKGGEFVSEWHIDKRTD